MANLKCARFRFSLRGLLSLVVICALLAVVLRQHRQAEDLRSRIRLMESYLVNPAHTVQAVSYIEVVNLKNQASMYTNKVSLASDGRKRVEHLSSKRRSVSIFDDSGIQRLYLFPTNKAATVFEPVEVFGGGQDLKDWIDSFQLLAKNADLELGRSELYGRPVVGFSTTSNGGTYTIWADAATGELRHVEIDSPTEKMILEDIRYHDNVDASMFSFDVPKGYTVIEKHLANRE